MEDLPRSTVLTASLPTEYTLSVSLSLHTRNYARYPTGTIRYGFCNYVVVISARLLKKKRPIPWTVKVCSLLSSRLTGLRYVRE